MKRNPDMIEMDELLTGSPSWPQVVEFWKDHGFDSEEYLVAAIKKHLLTDEQSEAIRYLRLDILDLLNGNYGRQEEDTIGLIYDAWNHKLGYKAFGS